MAKEKIYISKEKFYLEMVEYNRTKVISNKLGKKIQLLAKHIARLPSFSRYFHADLDDMKTDAIIACLKSLPKFDMKLKDPFAYFTTVVLNAFKYYLKRKYKNDNFRMKLIEEIYTQNDKQFTNEIKKDIIESKKKNKQFTMLD